MIVPAKPGTTSSLSTIYTDGCISGAGDIHWCLHRRPTELAATDRPKGGRHEDRRIAVPRRFAHGFAGRVGHCPAAGVGATAAGCQPVAAHHSDPLARAA